METDTSVTLVGRYRFDSFVVGSSNRFAWAAAMAVAEQPGTHYNPLFIYGPAGLGKTHLLHAVGHLAVELYPGLGVRYITSERFLNDFIDSIRRKRVDTSSIDTVDRRPSSRRCQVLEGKEQILEEFFHTFNSLYESGKQMVSAPIVIPANLSPLEDRLRSRFEGAFDRYPAADVETRLAILRRNAEFAPGRCRGCPRFIASVVSDNIRELEGALTRSTAGGHDPPEYRSGDGHRRSSVTCCQARTGKALAAEDIIRQPLNLRILVRRGRRAQSASTTRPVPAGGDVSVP